MIDDSRARFFWRLLLIASMIAALVSLLTTGLGLSRYLTLPLAWALAIAVQLGLFGLAWLIGMRQSTHRLWISILYCITMLFSVTFSYVTLQSELTERIKPAESRQQLFDRTRSMLHDMSQLATAGLQASDEIGVLLESWVDLERREGWATRTCEAEEHCYTASVCQRMRRRIAQWEHETGRTYREGPGEKLIYSALQTERESLEKLAGRLRAYRQALETSDVLEGEIDNRERLVRLDALSRQAPRDDLSAVLCEAVSLPALPAYLEYSRDQAGFDEQPVYAWSDLLDAWMRDGPLERSDYPTFFALALALFIDSFVLAVALGASVIVPQTDRGFSLALEDLPSSWRTSLDRDLDSWLDASMVDAESLDGEPESGARRAFLRSILDSIRLDTDGLARLIPEDARQVRFGQALVQAGAATVHRFVKFNRSGRIFELDDWVYPALNRRFSIEWRRSDTG